MGSMSNYIDDKKDVTLAGNEFINENHGLKPSIKDYKETPDDDGSAPNSAALELEYTPDDYPSNGGDGGGPASMGDAILNPEWVEWVAENEAKKAEEEAQKSEKRGERPDTTHPPKEAQVYYDDGVSL